MPAFHSVAPTLVACSLGGCQEAPAVPFAFAVLVGASLLFAWAFVQASPKYMQLLHSKPALLLGPMIGIALATHVASAAPRARNGALVYLVLWNLSIVPVLTLKATAHRRRPVACDEAHIGAGAVEAAFTKALPAITRMHGSGDSNAAFPSGDAAGAAAFAYPLLRCAPLWSGASAAWMVPALGCLLVALSMIGRMYFQAHHLMDTVCGAAFAFAVGVAYEAVTTGAFPGSPAADEQDVCSTTRSWWEPLAALGVLIVWATVAKLGGSAPTGKKVE